MVLKVLSVKTLLGKSSISVYPARTISSSYGIQYMIVSYVVGDLNGQLSMLNVPRLLA